MKRLPLLFLFITVVANTTTTAQVPGPLAEWTNSPASILMTKADREEWDSLRSAEEAERFLQNFWARRDPTPETPEHELMNTIRERIEAADREFSSESLRGSLSDRGKALIVLGLPTSRSVPTMKPTKRRVTRCCDDLGNSYVEEVSTFTPVSSNLRAENWKYVAAQVSWGVIAGRVDLEFGKQAGKTRNVVIRKVRSDRISAKGEQAFEQLLELVASTYIVKDE